MVYTVGTTLAVVMQWRQHKQRHTHRPSSPLTVQMAAQSTQSINFTRASKPTHQRQSYASKRAPPKRVALHQHTQPETYLGSFSFHVPQDWLPQFRLDAEVPSACINQPIPTQSKVGGWEGEEGGFDITSHKPSASLATAGPTHIGRGPPASKLQEV